MKKKRNAEATEDSWLSSWTSNDEQTKSISNKKNETLHSQSKKKKSRSEPEDSKKEAKSSKSKQKENPSAKGKPEAVKRR